MQAPVLQSLPQTPVDELTLKVVLPEGATNILLPLPFPYDTHVENRTYTYLDTIGRPTIYLYKTDVCEVHGVPFQVCIERSRLVLRVSISLCDKRWESRQ